MWVKASIEHRSLLISYQSEEGERTRRVIYPDWVEPTKNGLLLWGWDPRQRGTRSFYRHNLIELKYHGREFSANPRGKYRQLQTQYDQWKLDTIPWQKEPEEKNEEDEDNKDAEKENNNPT